jgi:hypothetical protein
MQAVHTGVVANRNTLSQRFQRLETQHEIFRELLVYVDYSFEPGKGGIPLTEFALPNHL